MDLDLRATAHLVGLELESRGRVGAGRGHARGELVDLVDDLLLRNTAVVFVSVENHLVDPGVLVDGPLENGAVDRDSSTAHRGNRQGGARVAGSDVDNGGGADVLALGADGEEASEGGLDTSVVGLVGLGEEGLAVPVRDGRGEPGRVTRVRQRPLDSLSALGDTQHRGGVDDGLRRHNRAAGHPGLGGEDPTLNLPGRGAVAVTDVLADVLGVVGVAQGHTRRALRVGDHRTRARVGRQRTEPHMGAHTGCHLIACVVGFEGLEVGGHAVDVSDRRGHAGPVDACHQNLVRQRHTVFGAGQGEGLTQCDRKSRHELADDVGRDRDRGLHSTGLNRLSAGRWSGVTEVLRLDPEVARGEVVGVGHQVLLDLHGQACRSNLFDVTDVHAACINGVASLNAHGDEVVRARQDHRGARGAERPLQVATVELQPWTGEIAVRVVHRVEAGSNRELVQVGRAEAKNDVGVRTDVAHDHRGAGTVLRGLQAEVLVARRPRSAVGIRHVGHVGNDRVDLCNHLRDGQRGPHGRRRKGDLHISRGQETSTVNRRREGLVAVELQLQLSAVEVKACGGVILLSLGAHHPWLLVLLVIDQRSSVHVEEERLVALQLDQSTAPLEESANAVLIDVDLVNVATRRRERGLGDGQLQLLVRRSHQSIAVCRAIRVQNLDELKVRGDDTGHECRRDDGRGRRLELLNDFNARTW